MKSVELCVSFESYILYIGLDMKHFGVNHILAFTLQISNKSCSLQVVKYLIPDLLVPTDENYADF